MTIVAESVEPVLNVIAATTSIVLVSSSASSTITSKQDELCSHVFVRGFLKIQKTVTVSYTNYHNCKAYWFFLILLSLLNQSANVHSFPKICEQTGTQYDQFDYRNPPPTLHYDAKYYIYILTIIHNRTIGTYNFGLYCIKLGGFSLLPITGYERGRSRVLPYSLSKH